MLFLWVALGVHRSLAYLAASVIVTTQVEAS